MPWIVNWLLNLCDKQPRKFLHSQKGLVLDVGCGDGRLLDHADVGVDFSNGMLQRAKKKGKPLIRGCVWCLPFRNHVFEVAFMATVMQHIHPSHREQAWFEMWRVADIRVDFSEGRVLLLTKLLRLLLKLKGKLLGNW